MKVQITPGALGTTISKSDSEKPDNINKYRSFVGKLMWYTTKVVLEVVNEARELVVHMSHPVPEHWKVLGQLIGYLKGKDTKGIIVINHKVLKSLMLCDSNFATDKDTRKSVSGLVTTLACTILT